MVKKPDRFYGEDLIEGSYHNISFSVSDVNLKERVTRSSSNWGTRVTYESYFKGRWYIFRLHREFSEVLRIVEGRGYQVHTDGLIKIETESIKFNEKISVWASSDAFAFYVITPVMIEKLLQLEELHRGSTLFYIKGMELHVGINDHKDYMEMSLKKPLDEEAVQKFMFDIEMIQALILELKLDSSKFMDNTLGGQV